MLDNSMLHVLLEHDDRQPRRHAAARGDARPRRRHRSQTGRVLDYLGKPNRQMCRLYLSMMDKMDVRLDKFGDATEPLAEV